MSQMFNPPHPAEILREDILPSLALTVTEAAKQLGVSRAALSRVLNERAVYHLRWRYELKHGRALNVVVVLICGYRCKLSMICGRLVKK